MLFELLRNAIHATMAVKIVFPMTIIDDFRISALFGLCDFVIAVFGVNVDRLCIHEKIETGRVVDEANRRVGPSALLLSLSHIILGVAVWTILWMAVLVEWSQVLRVYGRTATS